MTGSYDWTLWLVLVAIGLATTLPRASFIVLGERVELPPVVQRALRYAPAAALAAIVAPDVFVGPTGIALWSPPVGAALAVVAVVGASKNPWAPFAAGMAALWALRWLLG